MSGMGLSIAASAIQADQAQMATVADNLANAGTVGYARQRVEQTTLPSTGPDGAGGGVSVTGVAQLHSALLDAALRTAQANRAAAQATDQAMSSIQGLFPEPSSSGLSSQLSQLWSDLSSLASSPGNTSAQTVVIGDLGTVTSTLRSTYQGLAQVSAGSVSELGGGSGPGVLAQANGYLASVADLNARIVSGQATGNNVNSLVDQRRADLSQLAELVGATARPEPGGSVTVRVLGVTLVQGTSAVTLTTSGSPPDPPPAAGSPPSTQLLVRTATGTTVAVGGQAGALLGVVDRTVPAYQAQLSAVTNALATSLDSLQSRGFDAAGTPGSSLPTLLVTSGSSGFVASASSAGSVEANPALSAGQIATAGPGSTTAGTATLDGSNAAAMAAMASNPNGPDAIYRQFVGALGSAAAQADQAAKTATTLRDQAAATASSVSGVDPNAEATDMVRAQQAFQAAAKVIAAIATSVQSLLQAV